ncbi:MAG: CDP-diacylglycerol--serine O-phosphatidyltransferase [Desulfonatronovibrionaceae bacterium]
MPEESGPRYKGFYILPNLLTTASMFSGFWGILAAVGGRFELCAVCILISCFFDGMDGKVARLTKTGSDFGVQFDSLADLVSFGVAPAIMTYLWQTQNLGRLGVTISFLFVASGALRLARFNIQSKSPSSGKFFIGLPIPAAACTLATLVLFSRYLPQGFAYTVLPWFTLVLALVLALLMVSQVKYASFKEVEAIRAHPFTSTGTVIFLFVLVASEPRLFGFLFFMGYLLSGVLYSFLFLPLRKDTNLRESLRELS